MSNIHNTYILPSLFPIYPLFIHNYVFLFANVSWMSVSSLHFLTRLLSFTGDLNHKLRFLCCFSLDIFCSALFLLTCLWHVQSSLNLSIVFLIPIIAFSSFIQQRYLSSTSHARHWMGYKNAQIMLTSITVTVSLVESNTNQFWLT